MKRISEIELDKALELSACQHCGMPSHKLTTATISWGDNPPTDLHVDLCQKCLNSLGKRDKIKETIRGVNDTLKTTKEDKP